MTRNVRKFSGSTGPSAWNAGWVKNCMPRVGAG
jgi:hypothetical protein